MKTFSFYGSLTMVFAKKMDVIRSRFVVVLMLMLSGVVCSASAQTSLENVSFTSLPGEMFEIELSFDSVPPTPDVFEIESPARLSMDFVNVVSGLEERRFPVQFGIADSIMILEAQGRTRMVVNLLAPTAHGYYVQGNSLIVIVGEGAAEFAQNISPSNVLAAQTAVVEEIPTQVTAASVPVIPTPVTPVVVSDQVVQNVAPAQILAAAQQQAAPVRVIQASDFSYVEFHRSSDGAGQIVIGLANDGLVGVVSQSGRSLELEFANTELSESMQERLDVIDFATPVQFIDVYAEGNNVMVVANVLGEYEYIAYQNNDEYIISVTPILASVSSASSSQEAFEFTGERIDLEYQDIPVRSVLQILAEFNNFNLIVSDTVEGNITLQARDVPWDQALDLILTVRGLDKRLSGNVLYVAPAAEIANAELQVLENNMQIEALAALVTEYLEVKFAVAEDLLGLLEGEDNSQGGGTGNSNAGNGANNGAAQTTSNRILSDRGTASVDTRTNTLIVQDVPAVINQVREMLAILDVPSQQVLIEARIVNASTQFSKALGVRWGIAQTLPRAGDGFVLSGDIASTTTGLVGGGGPPNLSFPQALMVDLGVNLPSSSIALGYAGDNGLLQLELTALEDSGNGEVIAQPKITTLDLETAKIESGIQVPYQAQAGGTAGGSTTEFIAAVLSLEVTPQITPDGRIIMLLDIHQDSVIPAPAGSVPAISTNSLTTRVLVDDGATIVLGGVFREEMSTTVTKTPVLGDIPYLGALFKRTEETETKTELLIFITPSIITEGL